MTLRTRARRNERPRPFLLSLLLLAAVSAAPLAAFTAARQDETADAAPARAAKSGGAEFVPGEALVRFRGEAEDGAEAEVEIEDGSRFGALPGMGFNKRKVRARFQRFDGSEIVRGLRLAKLTADSAAADAKQTLAAIAELDRRPDVLYAEPNYVWRAKATPNDPMYGQQYAMPRISAPAAWDKTKGSQSVVVAVIDSGVDLQHEDLKPNAWVNPVEIAGNNIDEDGNGFFDDVNGWDFSTCTSNDPPNAVCGNNTVYDSPTNDSHGTHVAGIIGAQGHNDIGVTGVNWEVSIMSVKVLGPGGGDTADIIRGYNYVRTMRELWASTNGLKGANVRVTNNSYGGPGKSLSALAAINALNTAGILFVAAAGNDARDNFSIEEFPSNYDAPNVLAVASTNTTDPDGLSGFSNFSSRLVSMGAPGSSILSTFPENNYSLLNGTSMSSPHVAGAGALVCSAVPDCANNPAINSGIPVAQLRGLLAFTGDRIAALQDNTTTGRRLNVNNAVVQAQTADNAAPGPTALSVAAQSGRSLTLSFNAPGDDYINGAHVGTAADYDFFFVNPALNVRVLMPTNAAPAAGGAQQQVTVETPLRNFSGTVELVAYDEHGNRSVSALAVNVPQNAATDPYAVTVSDHEPLSTGGTRILDFEGGVAGGDDKYRPSYTLPFAFPFYGQQRTQLTISTNGVLYFSTPPRRDNGDADDVPSSVAALQGQTLIAPLWDDLDLRTCFRPDAGVYEIRESQRLVLRWQGVSFQSLDCPASPPASSVHVNFEVELRADGVISFRYGAGNLNLFPVVAISGGEPSAYDVASHTSEFVTGAQAKNLTDAQTVRFTPRSQQGLATLQFNTASFSASEADGRATLTVTRSGDTQAAGSVQVRTVDNAAAVRCDDTTTLPGVAFARCDYSTTVETLSFAPGELSKTFTVPLVNDAHVEPNETVQIILHSPAGNAVLGAQTTLTLSIVSDDAGGSANPVEGPPHEFFVRQHYLDFLSREPEPSGLQAWLNVLNNCPNVYNHDPANASAECDRNRVSSAFFRSEEFELKGAYVFRLYRVAFGRLPLYSEIIPDMRAVTGQTAQEVFQKKAAFAEQFAARAEFQTAHGGATNADFVNTLMNRYNLQQITTPNPAAPDGNAKITLARQELIDMLTAGTLTRGKVLRAVADSDQVEQAERDRTFVAMQYFGYLRRDPDQGGFDSWMQYLATHPGDYYTMVNGFLYSPEYKLRFGSQ